MAAFLFKSIIQVVVIGLIAFAGPGIFNAMQGLGAAGSGDPETAAVANGCLYGLFAVTGYLSGPLFNMLGPKLCMIFGGASYAIYALCMYYSASGLWVAAIAGVVVGSGAGIFWTAQSGLLLGYATESEKGKFSGLFWSIFQCGGVLGGLITLGVNWKRFDGDNGGLLRLGGARASAASYFTFVGIMAAGCFLSVFLLMPPKKVIKSDGSSPVVEEKDLPVIEELKAAMAAFKEPFIWKMLIYFFYSNWYYTFQFGALNGMFFNSRSAGLNSALYFIADVAAAQVMGKVCDWKGWAPKKRGRVAFFLVTGWFALTWALAISTMYTCAGGKVDKPNGTMKMDVAHVYAVNADGTMGNLKSTNRDQDNRDQIGFFPGNQDFFNPWTSQMVHFTDGCEFLDFIYCTVKRTDATALAGQPAYCKDIWTKYGGATTPTEGFYKDDATCHTANTTNGATLKNAHCLQNVMTCVRGSGNYGRGMLDVKSGDGAVCDVYQTEVCTKVSMKEYPKETALAIITYMVSGASDGFINTFLLWLIGMNAGKSVSLSVKYYALFKGTQNIGAATAWLSDMSGNFLYRYQTFVNVGMGAIALIGAFFSLSGIPDSDADLEDAGDEGGEIAVAEAESRSSEE